MNADDPYLALLHLYSDSYLLIEETDYVRTLIHRKSDRVVRVVAPHNHQFTEFAKRKMQFLTNKSNAKYVIAETAKIDAQQVKLREDWADIPDEKADDLDDIPTLTEDLKSQISFNHHIKELYQKMKAPPGGAIRGANRIEFSRTKARDRLLLFSMTYTQKVPAGLIHEVLSAIPEGSDTDLLGTEAGGFILSILTALQRHGFLVNAEHGFFAPFEFEEIKNEKVRREVVANIGKMKVFLRRIVTGQRDRTAFALTGHEAELRYVLNLVKFGLPLEIGYGSEEDEVVYVALSPKSQPFKKFVRKEKKKASQKSSVSPSVPQPSSSLTEASEEGIDRVQADFVGKGEKQED
jgi:hypothetical protein